MKLLLLATLLLTACHKDVPPGPTAEQSNQLNEAVNMLYQLAAKVKGPMEGSTGPSTQSK
jgi:outer membrane biogenesis lipoprotein LolB